MFGNEINEATQESVELGSLELDANEISDVNQPKELDFDVSPCLQGNSDSQICIHSRKDASAVGVSPLLLQILEVANQICNEKRRKGNLMNIV
eukprot:TRINITY_DN9769_c0_g1_i1.p1 TRINITY_DN9769_c0_g1~~TRINITY_DN9769_c0_g1_i1.p1  ORF type:complete len:106 (-),score=42.51 TRINITY_DN9769_c0_g1_i1:59-337(-)